MKLKPMNLDEKASAAIKEIALEWFSRQDSLSKIHAKEINHAKLGTKMLLITFDYIGPPEKRVKVPVSFQVGVAQISLKQSLFARREQYFTMIFQENERGPRLTSGLLYQPQEILVHKFNSSESHVKMALMDELLSESMPRVLLNWTRKAREVLS